MAVRGTVAKAYVAEKIREAFGADYVGEYDKKIIVWADDGGERVQIAMSLTCPKNVVLNENQMNYNTGIDFTNDNVIVSTPESTEITDQERENVRELMKRMGL